MISGDADYSAKTTLRPLGLFLLAVRGQPFERLRSGFGGLVPAVCDEGSQATLLREAADMIDILVWDAETGECSMCLAPHRQPHARDCSADRLLARLRIAAESETDIG